jgi:hypothetical protein
VAGSARFHRRVRVQGNRPRTSRLKASGVRARREQRVRNATRRSGPAGGYASVPIVFLQHTRVSSGGSAREQENFEVRAGVGIATQSGSIVSSQGPTTSSSSYPSLITQPTTVTTDHREENPSGHSPPTAIPWQASSSPTEPRHCRVLLIADLVLHGNSLSTRSPSQPKLPQGLPSSTESS